MIKIYILVLIIILLYIYFNPVLNREYFDIDDYFQKVVFEEGRGFDINQLTDEDIENFKNKIIDALK